MIEHAYVRVRVCAKYTRARLLSKDPPYHLVYSNGSVDSRLSNRHLLNSGVETVLRGMRF